MGIETFFINLMHFRYISQSYQCGTETQTRTVTKYTRLVVDSQSYQCELKLYPERLPLLI